MDRGIFKGYNDKKNWNNRNIHLNSHREVKAIYEELNLKY